MKMPMCKVSFMSSCFFFFFLFSFFLHPLAHTHFFAKKCVTFFVLFNGDIIVNLYQLYFPSSHFSS